MSELSPPGGSEQYGACDDEGRGLPDAPPLPPHLPAVAAAHEIVQAHVEVVGQKDQTEGGWVTFPIFIVLIGPNLDAASFRQLPLFQLPLPAQLLQTICKCCHNPSFSLTRNYYMIK